MNHEKQSRASSGKEVTASEMSSFHGVDGFEATKFDASTQPMPTPRSWSTATGETSREAAVKARSVSSELCRTILAYIRENGPASPEELREALSPLGFSQLTNSYRARTSDMAHAGLLINSGERGLSESGSRVIRWGLAPVAKVEAL
jgi:hypothetical protein